MRRWVWLTLLLVSAGAYAQPKLTLTIDRTILSVGESINLTVTLSGSANADQPRLPQMQVLQVVGGPYQSSSYEIVNGRASSSISWVYRLRATSTGRERVGPIELHVSGDKLSSNAITVNVLAGHAPSDRADESPDVLLRVTADKSEVYQGEQVTLTYRIFYAAQISQVEITKLPSTTGFWVEDLTRPQNQVLTNEVVNGRAYTVAVVRKLALFPTTSGELNVEPMVISTRVQRDYRRRNRDPLDAFFNDPFFSLGRQVEQIEVTSSAISVRVKPLPSDGVPHGFAGAVGSFKVRAHLDRPVVRTDEAVTLTVQIEGVGNIKTLPQPWIAFPSDLEHYDPKATDQIRRDQQRVSGTKRYDYVIIPRAAGDQTIPPVSYVFFDPAAGRYSTVSTAILPLSVEKGGGSTSGIPVATKRGVESLATDIAYIKTRTGPFVARDTHPHEAATFWLLTAGPWVALAGLAVVVRRREGFVNVRRNLRRAFAKSRADLVLAEKSLKVSDLDMASRHISGGLDRVVHSVFGASLSEPNLTEIAVSWQAKGQDPALLERLFKIERDCDLMRFAPALADMADARALLSEARNILNELEKASSRVTM